jgi:succinate dehydrogenase / fumarate reductase membrane anchor subunit
LALVCVGAACLAFGGSISFERWQAWSASTPGALTLLLAAGAVIVHAWVGLRDVVLDYVHPAGARLAVLATAATGLLVLAAWALLIVLRHAISHPALRP